MIYFVRVSANVRTFRSSLMNKRDTIDFICAMDCCTAAREIWLDVSRRLNIAIVRKILSIVRRISLPFVILLSQRTRARRVDVNKVKMKINRERGQGRTGGGILRCVCLVSEKELCILFSFYIIRSFFVLAQMYVLTK